MPSHHSQQFTCKLTDIEFFEIATRVLRAQRYHIDESSEEFAEIVASERKSQRSGPTQWNYFFVATVRWTRNDDSLNAQVTVTEENYVHQGSVCSKRCQTLIAEMQSKATQIAGRAKKTPPSTYGSSSWATVNDLANHGYLIPKPHPQRLILAPHDDLFIAVPEQDTYKHALICGPTGIGKSTGFFIPNILERMETSMIITEATTREGVVSDLYKKTAAARRKAGHKIYYFNPTDMTSSRINPIDQVRFAEAHNRIVHAQKLANLIMQKLEDVHRGWEHWDKAARRLLIALIMHVAEGPERSAHFGTVRNLLSRGEEPLAVLMKESPSAKAKEEYEMFYHLATDKYAKGVMVTLVEHLDSWLPEQVVTLTAKSDVKANQLKDELFTLYLSIPSNRDDLKPLISIVFNYLLSIVLAKESKFEHPLALMLDEFTNFGAIPNITNILTTIRKEGIPILIGLQDRMQLEIVYGRSNAEIIWNAPCTRIFLQPNDPRTARVISDSLGKQTIEQTNTTERGVILRREMGRFLMTTDEVLNLDQNVAIVFTSATRPVKLSKFPPGAYQQFANLKIPLNDELPIDKIAVASGKQEIERAYEKAQSKPPAKTYTAKVKSKEPSTGAAPKNKSSDKQPDKKKPYTFEPAPEIDF